MLFIPDIIPGAADQDTSLESTKFCRNTIFISDVTTCVGLKFF